MRLSLCEGESAPEPFFRVTQYSTCNAERLHLVALLCLDNMVFEKLSLERLGFSFFLLHGNFPDKHGLYTLPSQEFINGHRTNPFPVIIRTLYHKLQKEKQEVIEKINTNPSSQSLISLLRVSRAPS